MKVIARIFSLIAGMLIALQASAQVTTDAPHNAAISMGCTDCHSQFAPGAYTDDVCLSCHTNATGGGYIKNSAPRVQTHASANTGDKYGAWSTTCISCHSRHNQEQPSAYGPAAHLVTGTISSVTDNGNGTTTFGYMNQVELLDGWGDPAKWGRKSSGSASGGNERGLNLFANLADLGVSFEVLSATATNMTVQGSVDAAFPGRVAPGNTFALVYGQLAGAAVSGRSVRFFQNSGPNSFAINEGAPGADPTPDGICQSCHTRTAYWRSDGSFAGHYSGANCTPCHRHEEGFKTSCDVCHTSPPQMGKHQVHAAGSVGYYGNTAVQSTASAYGYGCGTCHQGTHLNSAANPRTVETIFAGVAAQNDAASAAYTASTSTVDDPGNGYTFNYSDGSCANTYCHGNYSGSGKKAAAAWTSGAAPCGSCHDASNTSVPRSGSHLTHADQNAHNYACTLCHKNVVAGTGPAGYSITDRSKHVNGFVDWQFDTADSRVSATTIYSLLSGSQAPSDGLNRGYGTCSNTYCHSIGQTATGGPLTGAPGEYMTPQWRPYPGAGSYYCGSCHKNGSHHADGQPEAMDSGSHTKHLGYRFNTLLNDNGPSMKCAVCHKYDALGPFNSCDSCHGWFSSSALYNGHADGIVNVAIESVFGTAARYNDTSQSPGAVGNGFFSCSNTYCHGDGTSVSTGLITANTSSVWGSGTLSCAACHGNPPSYQNENPKKNSHTAHASEPCSKCHVTTTADGATIASATTHVNKSYDVAPETLLGVTFTYTFAAAGGSCTTISCHGGGTAQWGGTVPCQSCHLGTADVDDFTGAFQANGITSKIAGPGEWDTTGHGRASGSYASGNPAASFTVAHACQYCHDETVAHKTAVNPFRLRNIADADWGMNGVCQNCHTAGSAGISVDSVLKNGAKKVGSFHYGSKHSAGANGGQFCWDCHDPHGDGNIFMVHAAVAKTSDMLTGAPISSVTASFVSFATGTSYAVSTSPYRGICNVCHTSANHYTSTSGDDHNAGTRCTQCHAHTQDAKNEAFLPAGCDGCHGNPPVDNQNLVGFAVPSRTGSETAGAHRAHVNTLTIGCGACHANSAGSGTTHNNGDLKATIGFSLFNGSYVGGVYDGQTTVAYNASTPSTTVTGNGQKQCSNIYCHGSTMSPNGGTDITPVWDNPATAACGSCHGASAANPPRRGAHYRHTALSTDIGHEYPCSSCHQDPATDASLHVNNRSEVIFSTNPTVTGGLYAGSPAMLDAYGACTNVYCHSNVQTSPPGGPLTYKTINWGTSYGGDMGCNLCHEGPADHYNEPLTGISSGSHPKHAANRIYCATCHANDITQDPDPATAGYACAACHTSNGPNVTHANHAVDVNIVTKYSGAYTGTPAPGDAYGSCASTYCHSSGVSVRTTSIPMTMSAAWNSGTLACNACHGNTTYPAPNNAMPDYPNGTPKENSHEAHVISSGIPCQNCHAGTTANGMTIANAALHVNKTYDTQAAGSFNGKAISFAYTAATTTAAGSCSSISCHGGNAAAWGATLQCQDCHAGAVDVDDFSGTFWSDGTTGEISTSEWRATGHGRPAASGNYASGNPPAVLTTATTTNVKDSGCQFCHDSAVSHMNSANPFRLKNISSATWGKNGNCQVCHAAGSEGMTVDGVLRNGARKVGSNHYGSKHSTSAAGGQFCWDCHDPHGDGNIFMVHAAVAKTSDANTGAPTNTVATVFNAFAAGTDYARSAAPFTGVCNVCHVSTGHYTSTSGDGHNETVRCTQCHQHTDGFRPAGDNCSDCHSSAGGQTPGAIPDAYHAKHVQTAYAGKAALGDYGNYTTNQWYRYSSTGGVPDMGCGYCHPQNSATHMNGVVNLNFGPADAGAGGTLKAKNNATQTYSQNSRTSVTCSSVYCHSDGYFDGTRYGYKTSPEWYGGAYAGDKCAGCHANSPTSSAAHAAHVVGIHYKTIYTGATGLATAGNTDTSSHGYTDGNGNELTSTTINCNVCHYSTVTMPANDNNTVCSTCHSGSNLKGAMAVASVSSSHVNGAVDVAFAPVQVRSKAQLRDNITTVAELNNSWTRTNGYKTANSTDVSNGTPTYSSGSCSSVACHNGNTVAWTSGSLSCNACHTALPR